MRTMILLLIFCFSTSGAWAAESVLKKAQRTFKPIPQKPPLLAGNPANMAKVELGKKLYFDPRLSSSYLISCNTCHNVGLGGVDLQETSTVTAGRKGRGTPLRY